MARAVLRCRRRPAVLDDGGHYGEPWPAIFLVMPAQSHLRGSFRMGYGWYLETFDRGRWDAMFGSGTPLVEKKIRDALLGWEEGYDGTDKLGPGWAREKILASHKGREAIVLATHLARKGLTYDATQCARLDDLGCEVCVLELLGADLDVSLHSPGSLVASQIGELLDRLGYDTSELPRRLQLLRHRLEEPNEVQQVRAWFRSLARLVTGRCFETDTQPFSSSEVVELRNEVVAAISAPIAWRDPEWEPEGVETYFLAPLTKVVKTGRWLHMRFT